MRQLLRWINETLNKRPLLPTMISMGWNLTFALINSVFSLVYRSYWYLTLCALYLILGLMKMSGVMLYGNRLRRENDILRRSGLAMFVLDIILCGLMHLTIRDLHNPVRNKIVMLITAAYTFAFVGLTIINTIRAHKQKSADLISLRNISCAGSLFSILSLERSMLGTFGDASDQFTMTIQAWSGAVVFLILTGLGINMLILSRRYK